ncbi:MAG: iron permease [Anaerolineae bacterium]|nr:iron permease [Anaerolineae bacterium]
MKRRILTIIALVFLALCGSASHDAHAQTPDVEPAQIAESIRQTLFNAQADLIRGKAADATAKVAQAEALYRDTLRKAFEPAIAELVDGAFKTAATAATDGSTAAFAALRSQIWTGLLDGSTRITLAAVRAGDVQTAQRWLLLRGFRGSTRFSRPNADATLALNALASGVITPEAALQAVRADLYDAYQAQLNEALTDADQAYERRFVIKQAEAAGLAAGYFHMLGTAYLEQRSADQYTVASEAFTALVNAAQDSSTTYTSVRTSVDDVLKGFRAAPLSEKEQMRRAGQLQRFAALVPVEYARGVQDGRVIHDIEIQEALTFRDGAWAAFNDLKVMLEKRDPEATMRLDALLRQLDQQVRSTAAPGDVEASVKEIDTILAKLLPAEWQSLNAESDFDVINSVLDQVELAVKSGQYDRAESARLEAYALLEGGIEQKLRGFAPDTAARVEGLFWQGDSSYAGLATLIGSKAPLGTIQTALRNLKTALADAQSILGGQSVPEAVVGNAAIIVFREGLEAVLILASLLASLRTAESRRFRRPLVIGAALAFGATGITWWVANGLLTSLMRFGEKLEAVVSLIAIGVLLLITNWFFHKVYWTGWMANFHQQKGQIIRRGMFGGIVLGQFIGLVGLGFSSIYREGFETVLFLQSLVLESGLLVVLKGVLVGLIGVAIVGLVTFAFQVRLPYKKMLIMTGIMIGGVLLVMVGNTVHVLQVVGWLPITPIPRLLLPFWVSQWFGLYPTWQGIAFQIATAVFVIGSYVWAERINRQERSRKIPLGSKELAQS